MARKKQRLEAKLVDVTDKDLIFENVSCVDANGEIFENYPRIHLYREPEVNPKKRVVSVELTWDERQTVEAPAGIYFTKKEALEHIAEKGQHIILPSLALTCNFFNILYKNKKRKEVKRVLKQYTTIPSGFWTDTVLMWGTFGGHRDYFIESQINPKTCGLNFQFDKDAIAHNASRVKRKKREVKIYPFNSWLEFVRRIESNYYGRSFPESLYLLAGEHFFDIFEKLDKPRDYWHKPEGERKGGHPETYDELMKFFRNLTGLRNPRRIEKISRVLKKIPTFVGYGRGSDRIPYVYHGDDTNVTFGNMKDKLFGFNLSLTTQDYDYTAAIRLCYVPKVRDS